MLAQLRRLPDPVDPDHRAKFPGAAGLDPGERVLEHRRGPGLDAEHRRRRQVGVGGWLAPQSPRFRDLGVYLHVEQVMDAASLQDLRRVRHDDTIAVFIPAVRTAAKYRRDPS